MRKADNLQPSCAVVTKSGNFNFLEPSGPVHACNGTALPLLYYDCIWRCMKYLQVLHQWGKLHKTQLRSEVFMDVNLKLSSEISCQITTQT